MTSATIRPLAAILMALALSTEARASETVFEAPYLVFPSGIPGGSLSLADFNGDGLLDLVNVGSSSDCEPACGSQSEVVLSIALASPSGGFPREVSGLTPGEGAEIAIGDLDLDGRADMVLVKVYDGETHILLTRADRIAFDVKATYPTPRGHGVIIGDFTGDGRPDAAVLHYTHQYELYMLIGNGDGTFRRVETVVPGPLLGVCGDLNGDSRFDLLAVTGGNITPLLSTGDGNFAPGPTTEGFSGWCQLANVNGDHTPDLLVDGGVRLGRGDGSFAARVNHGVGGSCVATDLNEDGRTDLVVMGARFTVLLGSGDGHFTAGGTYDAAGSGGLTAHDLDGDGHVDLATAIYGARTRRERGWVYFFSGHGDGTFGGGGAYSVPGVSLALAVGDLNRDRYPDVVVASCQSPTVTVLLGSASGRLTQAAQFSTLSCPRSVVIDDFDVDGVPDLAVLDTPRLSVYSGRGDGSLLPPTQHAADGWATSLAAGDFNEDGRPDLVTVNEYPGSLSLFLGGATGFQPRVDFAGPHYVRQIAVADFTADGHLDVAAGNYEGIALFRGSGDGLFQTTAMDETPNYCEDESFDVVAAYDRLGDCRPTIAAGWSCCSYERPSMDCTFGTAFLRYGARGAVEWNGLGRSPGAPVRAIATGDLSGDGLADIAAAISPGAISVEIADGAGGFQPSLLVGCGASPGAVAIADMNADGRLDIVTANGGSSTVAVLLNRSPRSTVPPYPARVAAQPGEASIALSWDPVMHPGLSAYRVYYGRVGADPALSGTGATQGPSPLIVPAGRTDFTLTCLTDSVYALKITAVDAEGRESRCTPTIVSRPLPAGGRLRVTPRELNSAAQGQWIKATIDLGPSFTAENVIIGTIRLNGIAPDGPTAPSEQSPGSRLALRFPRAEVAQTLAYGRGVLSAEGLLRGCVETIRFAVHDTIAVDIGRRAARVVGSPGSDPLFGDPTASTGTDVPHTFRLHSTTPNPAAGSCDLGFDLPQDAPVRLQVFDVSGRLVDTLLDQWVSAGRRVARWNAVGLADGLYFVRLEAGQRRSTLRVVVAR